MTFTDMTDAELVECARRTSPGSTYRALADRIEQRSIEVQRLIDALTGCAHQHPTDAAIVRAVDLLARLEEDGTMRMIKRPGARGR